MSELEPRADWISSFLRYTAAIPSPKIFRLWSAITALSGAMERRMWIVTANAVMYPNLYTLLVSPPGVGKSQAINVVNDLWNRVPALHISPDNLTKASLLDTLAESKRQLLISPTQAVLYHTLCVAASEFGVFVPAHDLEFLSVLNHIFDNPASFKENRRTTVKTLSIQNPQLTILAGTQPAFLANMMPETAWGMGFTSRLLLIYSGTPTKVKLFQNIGTSKEHRDSLVSELTDISTMYGKYEFTPECEEEITKYYEAGCQPVPEHSKLAHYNSRRILHLLKLSMISAVSRSNELIITLADFLRAKEWLLEAEQLMPDIFRAMVLKSDSDLLQDMHMHLWAMFAKTRKPIHEARIIAFLQTKVPAERIQKIIDIAVAGGMITSHGLGLYSPVAKTVELSE